MASTDCASVGAGEQLPVVNTAATRPRSRAKQRKLRRFKGLSLKVVAMFAGIAALAGVGVPATLQAHPVQNPIILTSPADGSCVTTPRATLTWQPRLHAESYKVKLYQIHPDGSWELTSYPRVWGTYNTSWTTPILENEGTFAWAVKGENWDHGDPTGFGSGPFSDFWYFYTCY